ncbi:MAG: hypothetical protein WCX73_05505 [Candidatus Pacearchaeota archaeon]|jgi:hypothetical protein
MRYFSKLLNKTFENPEFQLEDILNSAELVLIDNSLGRSNDFFREHFYELRKLDSLSTRHINEETQWATMFNRIINHPNSCTIKELTQEKEKYLEIISEKIRYFKQRESHKVNDRWKKKAEKEDSFTFNKLIELQKLAYRIKQDSHKKELKFDTELYTPLVDIVKLLSQKMHLKTDVTFLKGITDEDASNKSDTDERCIAAGLYLSLYSDKTHAIISEDGDFNNLAGVIPRLVGANTLMPENDFFKRRLSENPLKVYFKGKDKKDYELRINSSNQRYDNLFRIVGLSNKEILRIEEQVRDQLRNIKPQESSPIIQYS